MSKLTHIFLFLLGLVATAWALVSIDKMPFWTFSRQKACNLAIGIHECDTIFIGSSRVQRGISPEIFDARMAELGQPALSFNFGMAGTLVHDFERQIDWILEQNPGKLERIIVEAGTYEQRIRSGQWMRNLVVEAHEPTSLRSRLSSVIAMRRPLWEKVQVTGYVLAHTLTNSLRIGQGPRILDDWCHRWTGRGFRRFGILPGRGFMPITMENAPNDIRRRQHQKWVANPKWAATMLDRKRSGGLPAEYRGGFDHVTCRRQIARLKEAGIELIYVVMPTYRNGFAGRDGLDDVANEVRIVRFDDPDAFPELYGFENWFDAGHMSLSGAELFSARLAEALVNGK